MALVDIRADDSATKAFLNGVPTNSTTGVNKNFDYGAAAAQLQHVSESPAYAASVNVAPDIVPSSPQQVIPPRPAVSPLLRAPSTIGYNFDTKEYFSGGHTFDAENGTQLDAANKQGLFDINNQTLPQGFRPVPAAQAKANLARMQQGRSYLDTAGAAATEFGHGVKYGLPEAGLQAAEYGANVVGAPDTAAWFHDKAAQIQGAQPPADMLARGDLAKTVINTAGSAPLSLAIGAGYLVNPALGAGLTAVGAGQQATQARDAVLANNGTEANANTAAWQNFVEEFAGEAAGGAIFRGMAHGTANVFGKLLGEGKITLKQAITSATNPAIAKNFLKNLGAGVAEESAVEYAQNDAETRSTNAYGGAYQDPEAQGLQGAEQAGILTPIMALMGLPSHLQAGKARAALGEAINNPNNPVDMMAASRIIHNQVRDDLPQGSADGWLGSQTRTANKYLRKQAIAAYEQANPEPTTDGTAAQPATDGATVQQPVQQPVQAAAQDQTQDPSEQDLPDDSPIPLVRPAVATRDRKSVV